MIEVIPAIDIIEGKSVRLTMGDYSTKKEYGDPLEMAIIFEDHGLKRLHLVDLDGAREGKVINYKVLERIAAKTSLVIDTGGGIKSDDDLRIVFESGAAMATGGSVAVLDPDLFEDWIYRFGSDRMILGSDFKEGKIAISGWQEESEQLLIPFLRYWIENGIKKTICTDVSKDGMLQGSSVDQYVEILNEFPGIHLIASGGVSRLDDIIELDEKGIHGVIVGKAIYEKKIELKDLEQFAK